MISMPVEESEMIVTVDMTSKPTYCLEIEEENNKVSWRYPDILNNHQKGAYPLIPQSEYK